MAGVTELKAAVVDFLAEVEALAVRELHISVEHKDQFGEAFVNDLQPQVDAVKQLQSDVVAAVVPPEALRPDPPAPEPVETVEPAEAPVEAPAAEEAPSG